MSIVEPMSYILARITIRDYVCSNCWGHLSLRFTDDRDLYYAICMKCGEHTKGYITKWYAEKSRKESIVHAAEVSSFYKDIIELTEKEKALREAVSAYWDQEIMKGEK